VSLQIIPPPTSNYSSNDLVKHYYKELQKQIQSQNNSPRKKIIFERYFKNNEESPNPKILINNNDLTPILDKDIVIPDSPNQQSITKKSKLNIHNSMPISPSAMKVLKGNVKFTQQQRMLIRDDPDSLGKVE